MTLPSDPIKPGIDFIDLDNTNISFDNFNLKFVVCILNVYQISPKHFRVFQLGMVASYLLFIR